MSVGEEESTTELESESGIELDRERVGEEESPSLEPRAPSTEDD